MKFKKQLRFIIIIFSLTSFLFLSITQAHASEIQTKVPAETIIKTAPPVIKEKLVLPKNSITKTFTKTAITKTKIAKTKIIKGKLLKTVNVNQGDLIGYEGGMPGTCGSGLSTGPHLHFEVRRAGSAINPRDLLGTTFIWPLSSYRVTQEFGPADWTPWYTFHTGIDLASNDGWGAPIYAAAAGRIVFNQDGGGYGHLIMIDHAGGLRTYYGHLKCS